MSTPSGLNHTHNTLATTNYLLHISQKQTTDYGTYSIICIAHPLGMTFIKEAPLKNS